MALSSAQAARTKKAHLLDALGRGNVTQFPVEVDPQGGDPQHL